MTHTHVAAMAAVALLVGMLIAAFVGHRHGRTRFRTDKNAGAGTGPVDAAALSLLGLLTAFTFSGAYSRYETRRGLVVQEANDIGTAYLRIALVDPDEKTPMRQLFIDYVQTRIDMWDKLDNIEAAQTVYDRSIKLQNQIWEAAVTATAGPERNAPRMLLLPALNDMFDVTTTRLMAMRAHPPSLIFLMLGVLGVASAWLVGFGMGKSEQIKTWHVIGLAAMSALTVYVILDIEYPRFGLVRLDAANALLRDVLAGMKPPR